MTSLPAIFDTLVKNTQFVGYDKMLEKLWDAKESLAAHGIPTFPPFNLKKIDDNKYLIEMALAGFTKQDIELTLADGTLSITGNVKNAEDHEAPDYLYRGIADRSFKRTFTLADTIEVKDAELVNGMLKVALEAIIPESRKPKQIQVK